MTCCTMRFIIALSHGGTGVYKFSYKHFRRWPDGESDSLGLACDPFEEKNEDDYNPICWSDTNPEFYTGKKATCAECIEWIKLAEMVRDGKIK